MSRVDKGFFRGSYSSSLRYGPPSSGVPQATPRRSCPVKSQLCPGRFDSRASGFVLHNEIGFASEAKRDLSYSLVRVDSNENRELPANGRQATLGNSGAIYALWES
jgi:hypothetical protein